MANPADLSLFDPAAPSAEQLGALGVQIHIGSDVEVDHMRYTISGPGDYARTEKKTRPGEAPYPTAIREWRTGEGEGRRFASSSILHGPG